MITKFPENRSVPPGLATSPSPPSVWSSSALAFGSSSRLTNLLFTTSRRLHPLSCLSRRTRRNSLLFSEGARRSLSCARDFAFFCPPNLRVRSRLVFSCRSVSQTKEVRGDTVRPNTTSRSPLAPFRAGSFFVPSTFWRLCFLRFCITWYCVRDCLTLFVLLEVYAPRFSSELPFNSSSTAPAPSPKRSRSPSTPNSCPVSD